MVEFSQNTVSEAREKPFINSSADLIISLDGFDGPLDLLLALAREQKVDLSKISIRALADQYLAFIASIRNLRLEIAADYLVMAAWLAYLKSRLLLPDQPEDEPEAVEMAEALKFQLRRLEAMREAAEKLKALPRLGIDVFPRGLPEEIDVEIKPVYYLRLYDLLTALGAPQRRKKPESLQIGREKLYSIEESMLRLRRLLGSMPDWSVLRSFLPEHTNGNGLEARSAWASTFAAVLEMVKEGELEVRQDGIFTPIYLRRRERTQSEETDEQ